MVVDLLNKEEKNFLIKRVNGDIRNFNFYYSRVNTVHSSRRMLSMSRLYLRDINAVIGILNKTKIEVDKKGDYSYGNESN